MKFTVDVDCTPIEARTFLGLPDLTPLHSAYLERMQKALTESMSPEGVAEIVKTWGPMSDAGMSVWRQMIEQMSGPR